MQGYCGSVPYLADFERQLDGEGRFEEFKETFEQIAGAPWEKKRQAFAVIQDKVVKTLVEMDFMSEEAARNWCKNAKGNYDLSIEKFVSLVQEYCAKKGPNHHVIFLVDEIGQYIADDTQLLRLFVSVYLQRMIQQHRLSDSSMSRKSQLSRILLHLQWIRQIKSCMQIKLILQIAILLFRISSVF